MNDKPFTRDEALAIWARLVAGHARHLDQHGSRTLMDGVALPAGPDAGGSYEGVTRMCYGWAGWLSQNTRSPLVTWRGEQYDIGELLRRAVLSGCDPHGGYWGTLPTDDGSGQQTVEAGHTMYCLYQSRAVTWQKFDPRQREQVVAYHERYAQRPQGGWRNNWALFWMLNHAARAALGQRHEPDLIEDVLYRYLDAAYCGDGWYDDAPTRGAGHFDDYTVWVFAYHVLCWADLERGEHQARRDELLGRVRALMEHFPYFFSSDGNYAHYGRSQIYKFARLGAALLAYRLGAWPHSPGMLKRLVGRHLRWYIDRGAVNAAGALIQPLTGQGSPEIGDAYNATGSQYWAMQAFGALWSLADDDPFWTVDEQPLPVEQGDFVKVLSQPGWVLVGTQASGEVQRFVAGSSHRPPSAAMYDKFVYATAAPFNCGRVNGEPSPDAMLCLTDSEQYGHREGSSSWAVGDEGWLRMRYTQTVGGARHEIDTTIIPLGEAHLRAHLLTLDPAVEPPGAIEGAAALGYSPGVIPAMQRDRANGAATASAGGRTVAIQALRGYDHALATTAWQGRPDLNSVHRFYALPMLSVTRLQPRHELVCLVHIGRSGDPVLPDVASLVEAAAWEGDGSFVLRWNGREIHVPPLA